VTVEASMRCCALPACAGRAERFLSALAGVSLVEGRPTRVRSRRHRYGSRGLRPALIASLHIRPRSRGPLRSIRSALSVARVMFGSLAWRMRETVCANRLGGISMSESPLWPKRFGCRCVAGSAPGRIGCGGCRPGGLTSRSPSATAAATVVRAGLACVVGCCAGPAGFCAGAVATPGPGLRDGRGWACHDGDGNRRIQAANTVRPAGRRLYIAALSTRWRGCRPCPSSGRPCTSRLFLPHENLDTYRVVGTAFIAAMRLARAPAPAARG